MSLPPDTPEQSELIDGPDAFRQALLHCASETRRTFLLYSPDLAREVYDLPKRSPRLPVDIARRRYSCWSGTPGRWLNTGTAWFAWPRGCRAR